MLIPYLRYSTTKTFVLCIRSRSKFSCRMFLLRFWISIECCHKNLDVDLFSKYFAIQKSDPFNSFLQLRYSLNLVSFHVNAGKQIPLILLLRWLPHRFHPQTSRFVASFIGKNLVERAQQTDCGNVVIKSQLNDLACASFLKSVICGTNLL